MRSKGTSTNWWCSTSSAAKEDVLQDLEGLSGPQKKQTVMIAVKDIYGHVNPDVPLIPEPFETWLEDFVLDKVLGVFIDHFVRSKKEKQADPS